MIIAVLSSSDFGDPRLFAGTSLDIMLGEEIEVQQKLLKVFSDDSYILICAFIDLDADGSRAALTADSTMRLIDAQESGPTTAFLFSDLPRSTCGAMISPSLEVQLQ